ncbi:uncharacterized protein LOC114939728 [Nylanderia fulva]|uniref:uncharacterized protein LOC114931617 n=1 Tax=Nylanderia fulva TaxID=613905 RepID=UPI0010FB9580|nr:uncharacterized protein LOC114931617 [Nylanderia fulva]XP_029163261.1 uncharacterized protein LOC114934720 [Nylanderia fulva]XP_029169986.1 uncharacterized protein LOC114939728 [Nylanderia fulva]
MNSLKYSVIEFVPQAESDEEEILVEVVPTKWISEDRQFCYYPPRFMKGKCMKMVMSLVDYDSSTWELLPIIFHHSYSTFNVARKARNKAVKEDTIVATDVETDYNQPRKRKPPEHLTFSSDSESVEESKKKKLNIPKHNIPKPSSILSSKLKELFESSKAKNSAKSTNEYFANSNLSSTSSKKNTTLVRRLSQEKSTQSESINKENLSDNEMSSTLRSPNSSYNFDLSEKASTFEQSPESQDILTKSDYDSVRQINKKKILETDLHH